MRGAPRSTPPRRAKSFHVSTTAHPERGVPYAQFRKGPSSQGSMKAGAVDSPVP
jgi:hypothetical protein